MSDKPGPNALGRTLYHEFTATLDPKTSYDMVTFNKLLEAYVLSKSQDVLVMDAAFDEKFAKMSDDCDGVMPQHTSL